MRSNLFESGDNEFKSTLIELIIRNILELKEELNSGELTMYQGALHKSRTALQYLNHFELSEIIEHIRTHKEGAISPEKLERLNFLVDEIISGLKAKMKDFA